MPVTIQDQRELNILIAKFCDLDQRIPITLQKCIKVPLGLSISKGKAFLKLKEMLGDRFDNWYEACSFNRMVVDRCVRLATRAEELGIDRFKDDAPVDERLIEIFMGWDVPLSSLSLSNVPLSNVPLSNVPVTSPWSMKLEKQRRQLVRDLLSNPETAGLKNREIGRRVGVSPTTVGNIRRQLTATAT